MTRPVRLIIQIPCYNEEEVLPATLESLPREVAGVDIVEWLVIDDGSDDRTAEVAREHGVDHIVRFPKNRGLARAFMTGLSTCLSLGADIIVNTDADNQYPGEEIEKLIAPVVCEEAEIVIGDRQIQTNEHFSRSNKVLQKIGSWVVRRASGTNVPDVVSGFRAFSREAALRVFVTSDYSYTIESIIQAGSHGTAIKSVSVKTNATRRRSRLIKNLRTYVVQSAAIITRVFTMYKPLRAFLFLAVLFAIPAAILFLRFLIHYWQQPDISRHVQSLIVVVILSLSAFQSVIFAFLADSVACNRKLSEDILVRLKRQEWQAAVMTTDSDSNGETEEKDATS